MTETGERTAHRLVIALTAAVSRPGESHPSRLAIPASARRGPGPGDARSETRRARRGQGRAGADHRLQRLNSRAVEMAVSPPATPRKDGCA
jgi:hypothetical protein